MHRKQNKKSLNLADFPLTTDELIEEVKKREQGSDFGKLDANSFWQDYYIPSRFIAVTLERPDSLEYNFAYAVEAIEWAVVCRRIRHLDPSTTNTMMVGVFESALEIWNAEEALAQLQKVFETYLETKRPNTSFYEYIYQLWEKDQPGETKTRPPTRKFDFNYEKSYNAAMERETKSQIGEMAIAQNTEALMDADELYVLLSSLISTHDPEPGYMGLRDRTVINQAIQETLEALPEDERQFFVEDETIVRALVDRKLYGAAREIIFQRYQEIEILLSDGREPPPEVKALLETLPQVDL